jgi:hypothetical protein
MATSLWRNPVESEQIKKYIFTGKTEFKSRLLFYIFKKKKEGFRKNV